LLCLEGAGRERERESGTGGKTMMESTVFWAGRVLYKQRTEDKWLCLASLDLALLSWAVTSSGHVRSIKAWNEINMHTP
jgi:hypothetical protein